MKKRIFVVLIVVMVLSLLAACGPDYSDEYEVLVGDFETLTDEWVEFGYGVADGASEVETMEDLSDYYEEIISGMTEYKNKYVALDDRLTAIQEGISEDEYTIMHNAFLDVIDGIDIAINEVNEAKEMYIE